MDRIPPYNIEAEQAVLSAVLLENDALLTAAELLAPEDFHIESHRVLFSAMLEMLERGMPVDLITLSDHLQATGRLEVAGGPVAVSELAGKVSTSANVAYWAGIVKDKSMLRKVIGEATAIVTEAFGEPEEVEEFLDRSENRILEISSKQTKVTYRPIKSVLHDSIRILEDLEDKQGALTGVPSGLKDLDQLTSGFQKGDLVILAARPSVGKTALALNIMRNAAVTAEKKVAFFSLEMAASQLVTRMICSESEISYSRLRLGNFKKHWNKLTNAADVLANSHIFIDDSSSLSALEVKAKSRRIKAESGLDLVIVDYLQLLRGSGLRRGRDSREQEIAEISRTLKGMAKELEVPVLALSQLNRAPETRGGAPRLSDLRESGAIEQDADVVMMMFKKPKKTEKGDFSEDEFDENITVLNIAKQRNGPTGRIHLNFLKDITKFVLLEGVYDEEYVPGGTG